MKTIYRVSSLILLVILAFALTAKADTAVLEEYEIKSGMLYNFTFFVEWPAESLVKSGTIDVCIAGDNKSSLPFFKLHGKPYRDRTLVVRQIRSPGGISGCNVLFLHNSVSSQLQAYLQGAQKRSVLTVSDIDNFASQGGIIGFFEEDDKVGFEINLVAARQSKIKINTQLLKLARTVRTR